MKQLIKGVLRGNLVLLPLVLVGCDDSSPPPADKSAPSFDTVRTSRQAPEERAQLDEISDSAVKDGARQQIVAADYTCNSIDHLWALSMTLQMAIKIMKAECDGGKEYQITLFNSKGYTKPWTGVLLGD